MFAGAWSPFTDLFGKDIQMGYADELLEQVFFSSFAGSPASFICISWLPIVNAPGRTIAKQIDALPRHEQATACLQMVMKHVENTFFNPDWFNALCGDERKQMDRLAISGVDPFGAPPSAPILMNLAFELPSVVRSLYVSDQ
jgi:hypothetical protein